MSNSINAATVIHKLEQKSCCDCDYYVKDVGVCSINENCPEIYDHAIKFVKEACAFRKAMKKIEDINPVDYGSMFSYEAHHAAKEVLHDVIEILEDAMNSV